jgi:hypothetical protein
MKCAVCCGCAFFWHTLSVSLLTAADIVTSAVVVSHPMHFDIGFSGEYAQQIKKLSSLYTAYNYILQLTCKRNELV